MNDRSTLDKKSVEVVKELTRIILTGGTPQQIGNLVMEERDLRDAVKAVLLRDVDEQCKKLCKKSDDSSSVLRVPRSKHKVTSFKILICRLSAFMAYMNLWMPEDVTPF